MSGAFGIAQNSEGKGLLARDLRKIIEGSYTSPGIIQGGEVTGNQNLTYHVEETVGLVSRGAADGMSMFYLSATDTPEVAPGTSLPRIDTIWVKALDPEMDDDQYGVRVGVTSGTPSQTPLPPTLDPSATRIIDMQVKPNTTNLANGATVGGSYDYAIPYGSTLGRLGINENKAIGNGDATIRKWFIELDVPFYVPTDRYVELIYNADVAYLGGGTGDFMTWATEFVIDGTRVPNTARESYHPVGLWVHTTNNKVVQVGKGQHLAQIKYGMAYKTGNGWPYFHYGENGGLSYPGRRLEVWDRGVAE